MERKACRISSVDALFRAKNKVLFTEGGKTRGWTGCNSPVASSNTSRIVSESADKIKRVSKRLSLSINKVYSESPFKGPLVRKLTIEDIDAKIDSKIASVQATEQAKNFIFNRTKLIPSEIKGINGYKVYKSLVNSKKKKLLNFPPPVKKSKASFKTIIELPSEPKKKPKMPVKRGKIPDKTYFKQLSKLIDSNARAFTLKKLADLKKADILDRINDGSLLKEERWRTQSLPTHQKYFDRNTRSLVNKNYYNIVPKGHKKKLLVRSLGTMA